MNITLSNPAADRRQWMAIGVLSSTALIILMVIFAL